MEKRHWLVSCGILVSGILATSAFSAHVPVVSGEESETVIYGDDDRLDLFAVKNKKHLDLAKATAVLISSGQLTQTPEGNFDISADPLGPSMGLCKTERFYDQPSAGYCSGALVGEDLLITAGHCITSETRCQGTKFVLNYAVKQDGQFPTQAKAEDVLGCKEIVSRKLENYGADYALIRLDRAVKHVQPLRINRAADLKAGDSLGLIGHPSGLPTKVAFGDSVVRNVEPNGYFLASLDAYGGNSGSAVFNANTGLIEGILVRGERDFVYQGGCRVSNQCAADGCRGEDVTKIGELADLIPEPPAPRRPRSKWPTL
jgi:hypothetical protein